MNNPDKDPLLKSDGPNVDGEISLKATMYGSTTKMEEGCAASSNSASTTNNTATTTLGTTSCTSAPITPSNKLGKEVKIPTTMAETIALLSNTKSHHHSHRGGAGGGNNHSHHSYSNYYLEHDDSTKAAAAALLRSMESSESMLANKQRESNKLRRIAIDLSLYVNLFILATKLYAYIRTLSLSVLAALTDSVLDVVSQLILNYTEKHSSLSRSSALYPAGASRLEPVGVLTCAALMGMASFEIVKESLESLFLHRDSIADEDDQNMGSFWSMLGIVFVKIALLVLCNKASTAKSSSSSSSSSSDDGASAKNNEGTAVEEGDESAKEGEGGDKEKKSIVIADPTLEALAQDHLNDALSNAVAAVALLFALSSPSLWFLDPIGAIIISLYIIFSWFSTGKEQIEQLTGKSAPEEFIEELYNIANTFDSRMMVDVCRAYHFGPKFLVEIEVVLPKDTLLFESHDLGMELQYEIEGREEVERCFVHIDYESRPYDEHVVSKVPELREKYLQFSRMGSCNSI